MKNQNLTFNDKMNIIGKNRHNKSNDEHLQKKKKRSASPMTKNVKATYSSGTNELVSGVNKPKSRSGSRKTNMRSPNNFRIQLSRYLLLN